MAHPDTQAPSPASLSALNAFNTAAPAAAQRDLLACCASGSFANAIAAGRPYRDPDALQMALSAVFNALPWADIVQAVNAHPRIGDRALSESSWSRTEQPGAAAASDAVRQALAAGNLAYERRFGYVFLICATGLCGQDMLEALNARLLHDDNAERAVVRQELGKITRLRMTKLLGL